MLSLKAVILVFYVFFKLGSLMPAVKHLLVELEDKDNPEYGDYADDGKCEFYMLNFSKDQSNDL